MPNIHLKPPTKRREDLIEHLLMAGFLAGATISIMPGVAASICPMLGQIVSAIATMRMGLPVHL
jgi:hypothetical protein